MAAAKVEGLTREQLRSRRRHPVRPCSVGPRLSQAERRELEEGRALFPEPIDRPRVRGDCENGVRPCPFVACRHHLYLDVSRTSRAIKLNFPDLDVSEMRETCALDVAEHGGATLEEVGAMMNLTRERIRQLEARARAKMKRCRLPMVG